MKFLVEPFQTDCIYGSFYKQTKQHYGREFYKIFALSSKRAIVVVFSPKSMNWIRQCYFAVSITSLFAFILWIFSMKWFQAFYLLLNSNRRIGLTSYHVCPLTIYMLLLIFHITHATCLKTLNNKQYLKNEYFSTDAKVSTITYSHFIVGTYRS